MIRLKACLLYTSEARFAAEEAFLIRVQNRDHRDLGDVKALAQEVDADEHVELAEAQPADELQRSMVSTSACM